MFGYISMVWTLGVSLTQSVLSNLPVAVPLWWINVSISVDCIIMSSFSITHYTLLQLHNDDHEFTMTDISILDATINQGP